MDARKERKSVCLSVIDCRKRNAKNDINKRHFLDAINGWTSLMDGILMDDILLALINGRHQWMALMDGINGWH